MIRCICTLNDVRKDLPYKNYNVTLIGGQDFSVIRETVAVGIGGNWVRVNGEDLISAVDNCLDNGDDISEFQTNCEVEDVRPGCNDPLVVMSHKCDPIVAVRLLIGTKSVRVIGKDLILAVENCMNLGERPPVVFENGSPRFVK